MPRDARGRMVRERRAGPWRGLLSLALMGVLTGTTWAQTLHFAFAEPAPQIDSGALTVVLLIRNTGPQARSVSVDPELPPGWVVAGALPSVSIRPGAQRAYPLVLHGIERGTAGLLEATLRFRDSTGLEVGALPLRVEVPIRAELRAEWLHAPALQVTDTLRLSLEVRDAGNLRELVQLRGDADVRFEPAAFPLDPGTERVVQVLVAAAPALRAAQTQRLVVIVSGEHAGAVTLTHDFTRVPTLLDESQPWHNIPLVARFSARTETHASGVAVRGVRLGLSGGGAVRGTDRLTFALDATPLAYDARLMLAYTAPQFSVRVGHGRIGLHSALMAVEGFGALVTGQQQFGGALTLAWAGFAQATSTAGDASETRFGLRVGANLSGNPGVWGRGELALQREPTHIAAQTTLRVEANPAPQLRFSVELSAGFDTRSDALQAETSAALRVNHPVVNASADLSVTPAGFAGEARERSNLGFGLGVDLAALLALHPTVIDRFELQIDARSGRSVVAEADPKGILSDPLASAVRYAALDRFGVEVRAAAGAVAGSLAFVRSSEEREADREQTLEHRFDASLALRVSDRTTLTPRVGWRARDLTDPLTGWARRSDEFTVGVTAGVMLWSSPQGPVGGSVAPGAARPLDGFRVSLHADAAFSDGVWTPWGGATLRWPRLIAEGFSLDLRSAVALTEAGLRTDLSARTDLALGCDATLTLEAATRFGADAPSVSSASLTLQHRFALPTHRRADLGSLHGTLRLSDGTPIANAVVRVAGQWLATGPDGSFAFPAIPVGTHAVEFVATTLPYGLLLSPPSPHLITVEPGAVSELTQLVLAPGGASVRVRYEPPTTASQGRGRVWIGSGDPVVDAAYVAGLSVTLTRGSAVWRALSDADGWVHFRDLEPGAYRLDVDGTRLPSTLRLGAFPSALQVAEGATTTLTIPLTPLQRPLAMDAGAGVRAP